MILTPKKDYYTRTFLRGHSPSSVAYVPSSFLQRRTLTSILYLYFRWMGSFQLALPFAFGPIAGRIFDAGYARALVAAGSLLFVFS